MVAIRRPTAKPKTPLLSVRNAIIFIIVWQSISLLVKLSSKSKDQNLRTEVSNLEKVLKDVEGKKEPGIQNKIEGVISPKKSDPAAKPDADNGQNPAAALKPDAVLPDTKNQKVPEQAPPVPDNKNPGLPGEQGKNSDEEDNNGLSHDENPNDGEEADGEEKSNDEGGNEGGNPGGDSKDGANDDEDGDNHKNVEGDEGELPDPPVQRVAEVKVEPQRVAEVKVEPQRVAEVKKVEPQRVPEVKKVEPQRVPEVKKEEPQRVPEVKKVEPQRVAEAKVEVPVVRPKMSVPQNVENAQVLAKHGSGPTKLGYVVDLLQDRNNAPFRNTPLPDRNRHVRKVAALLGEDVSSVHSCEYYVDRRWRQHSACRDPDTRLIVYNAAAFPRNVCGNQVQPLHAIKLEEHCNEPVHISAAEQDPPVHGKNMPHIVIQTTFGAKTEEKLHHVRCDVPCQIEGGAMTAKEFFIAGTDWQITRIMDDPALNANAKVERTDYRKNRYYSTTSFQSSIPLTYFDPEKYDLRKVPQTDYDSLKFKATYLLNEQCTSSNIRRHKWFAAVDAIMSTEAYGSCHHNKDLLPNETIGTLEGRLQLYKRNRIALAFETGSEKDYITDIVWEALMSGSVPAILGATNLNKHLPKKAAIYASDFNAFEKFAEYVKNVASDKALWNSYRDWLKDEAELKAFEERYEFAKTHPHCRTCRWAYAKLYGLGWDHKKQIVKENHIPRQLCLDQSEKLAIKPFREVWPGDRGSVSKDEKCPKYGETVETIISVEDATIKRSIVHHDGVTDLVLKEIEGVGDDIVLRLEVPIRNTDGAYFRDTHTLVKGAHTPVVSSVTIQDEFSKMTVLANWETRLFSPEQGVVELHFQAAKEADLDSEVRRIRVIVEDMSELHDKLTEYYPSSFARVMTQDFVDPIEVYYIGVEDETSLK